MKILAQESSWLEEMAKNAKEATPGFVASWLERTDAALFSGLKNEAFGLGRGFSLIRLDARTIVTKPGVVTFRRRYYRDEAEGDTAIPSMRSWG